MGEDEKTMFLSPLSSPGVASSAPALNTGGVSSPLVTVGGSDLLFCGPWMKPFRGPEVTSKIYPEVKARWRQEPDGFQPPQVSWPLRQPFPSPPESAEGSVDQVSRSRDRISMFW